MITKEEAVKNHRVLWHEIARKTREEKRCIGKSEVFKGLWPGEEVFRYCWCWEFANQHAVDCIHCPVVWNGDPICDCTEVEYFNWALAQHNRDWKKAAEIADIIAELPERNCTYE